MFPFDPKAPCPLCDRPLGDTNINRHHLIPKTEGGSEQFPLHRACHRKIHATFSEKELARSYATWDALRAHPDIAKFVAWVQRKPSGWYDGSIAAARRP